MSTTPALRTQRREIRLTADEAARIASLAKARGVSVSDYIRHAALRGTGLRGTTLRQLLPPEKARAIRELTAISADLHRLVARVEADPEIGTAELCACLSRVRTAIGEVAA